MVAPIPLYLSPQRLEGVRQLAEKSRPPPEARSLGVTSPRRNCWAGWTARGENDAVLIVNAVLETPDTADFSFWPVADLPPYQSWLCRAVCPRPRPEARRPCWLTATRGQVTTIAP
jgi:hypothetical protein